MPGREEAAEGATPGWEEGAEHQKLLQPDDRERERKLQAPLGLGTKVTPRPVKKRRGAG